MSTTLQGILLLTFRELRARKIIIALFVISTLIWLVLALALNPGDVSLPPELREEFGPDASSEEFLMRQLVAQQASLIAGLSYWGGTLLALFGVVPLFTGLLERGNIELLLSKPISRTRLLAGHLLGVLLLMLLLACYLIGAVWLALGFKTGVWNTRFLLAIPVLVSMFGVLYTAVVLVEIWTESTALGLITAFALIFISIVFQWHETLLPELSPLWTAVFQGAYHTLPNFAEVDDLILAFAQDQPGDEWYPLLSSLLFGAVCFGAAALSFDRRDF